jgi:hypothetical protein
MNPELSLLLGAIVGGTGALLSYWAGWRARGDVMRIRGGVVGSRRRTTCGGGEITQAQWEAMGTRRGSNPPPPGTKPQFPPARIISPDGTTIGYRPIPSRPGANPPPREP